MKVRFRGSANVTVAGRRPNQGGSTATTLARVLRRTVASQIRTSLANFRGSVIQTIRNEFAEHDSQIISRLDPLIRSIIAQTVPGIVQTALENELYSDRFAQFLSDIVSPNSNFGEIAEPFLQQNVELTTTGGTITGVLVEIGTDYVRIQETANSEVLVPFRNAISIGAA